MNIINLPEEIENITCMCSLDEYDHLNPFANVIICTSKNNVYIYQQNEIICTQNLAFPDIMEKV